MADPALDSVGELLHPLNTKGSSFLPLSVNETLKSALGEKGLEWTSLAIAAVVLLLTSAVLLKAFGRKTKKLPPAIPGLPILGNILQLRDPKPYRLFRDWSFKYGPIFFIKAGSLQSVVLNTSELCREAFVTRHSSISSRKHSTSMQTITEKRVMAMSDYGPHHIKLKKAYVGHLLAPVIQKSNRPIREKYQKLWIDDIFATVQATGKDSHLFDVTDLVKEYLYALNMEQVFGYFPDNVLVPDLGRHVGREEMYDILVSEILKNLMLIDYRNLFPALSFLGNKSLESKLKASTEKRDSVIDALIEQQKKLIETRGPTQCYGDILLTQYADWGPVQLRFSMWEPIIEGVDSSLVAVEWAMFEIVRNPHIQERLYKEIKSVVGDHMVTEDDLVKMPFLKACIQETMRVYSPLPLLPPRRVHEDTTIGGYHIPKGTDVLFNIYAVSMDPKVWKDPLKWDPDRLVDDDKVDMGIRDFRMLPFGGGKRICQGITQVMVVMPLMVASLVLHFEWIEPPQTEEERAAAIDTKTLLIHKLLPVKAIAKPRVGSRLKFPDATEMRL